MMKKRRKTTKFCSLIETIIDEDSKEVKEVLDKQADIEVKYAITTINFINTERLSNLKRRLLQELDGTSGNSLNTKNPHLKKR